MAALKNIDNNDREDWNISPLKITKGHKKETLWTTHDLIKAEVLLEMEMETLPDLREFCFDILTSTLVSQTSVTALNYIRALQKVKDFSQDELNCLFNNEELNHVLVDNDLMKIVLIHWPSGKIGNIHGHPNGGGVFKVLHGSIEELRYTTHDNPKFLSKSTYHKGAIGYIDDSMAYHAVGNPFDTSAVSLHAYARE